jgi:hypothetical protein
LAHGTHDVREIQIAGRDFVQHWSKQKEVVAIDERDFGIWIMSQSIVQVHRRVQSGETAA